MIINCTECKTIIPQNAQLMKKEKLHTLERTFIKLPDVRLFAFSEMPPEMPPMNNTPENLI
jgi:hypothetical protein